MAGNELDHRPPVSERWEGFPLNELPLHALATALSKTTPRDACRLAALSKTFAEAASSDLLWKEFLPADVGEILPTVEGGAPVCRRVKDLYTHLTNHVLLQDGMTGYFIDRDTGGVCRTFSARTLKIIWGDTPSYWDWLPCEGSRFREVAYLHDVCWLDISGEINCRLPPGVYTLSWVLKFERAKSHGWYHAPVTFTATDGTEVCESIVPKPSPSESASRRRGGKSIVDLWSEKQGSDHDEWWEYSAGDFRVTSVDDDAEKLGEIRLNFSMQEITRLFWKGGMFVDGVILRSKVNLGELQV